MYRMLRGLFPSPLGASYFQMETKNEKIKRLLFPSPLGASYFQIMYTTMGFCVQFIVSVPSRGILFPNSNRHRYDRHIKKCFRPLSGHLISKYLLMIVAISMTSCVSVPSRGILFPNGNCTVFMRMKVTGFPSPLGASYFQMLHDN